MRMSALARHSQVLTESQGYQNKLKPRAIIEARNLLERCQRFNRRARYLLEFINGDIPTSNDFRQLDAQGKPIPGTLDVTAYEAALDALDNEQYALAQKLESQRHDDFIGQMNARDAAIEPVYAHANDQFAQAQQSFDNANRIFDQHSAVLDKMGYPPAPADMDTEQLVADIQSHDPDYVPWQSSPRPSGQMEESVKTVLGVICEEDEAPARSDSLAPFRRNKPRESNRRPQAGISRPPHAWGPKDIGGVFDPDMFEQGHFAGGVGIKQPPGRDDDTIQAQDSRQHRYAYNQRFKRQTSEAIYDYDQPPLLEVSQGNKILVNGKRATVVGTEGNKLYFVYGDDPNVGPVQEPIDAADVSYAPVGIDRLA